MSSDTYAFSVHIEGAQFFTSDTSGMPEPLPASNDSWVLKLKPSVSYETVASSFLNELVERIRSWNHGTRQDAFVRMMYSSMTRAGPCPNLFFPDLGVFSSEIAMHSVLDDIAGHYAYGHE
jgi:hypothetical protein